ncbi:MAG: AEC family transporter [Candidatus Brocadiia bacterium]
MSALAGVFLSIILPIFVLIGVGVALDRLFRPDVRTLSKLNFYVFVPAFVFIKFLDADLALRAMADIAAFRLLHVGVLLGLALVLCRNRRLRPDRSVVTLAAMFFNGGNYGIPLVVFAWSEAMVGPLAIIIMINNLVTFTLGIGLVQQEWRGLGAFARHMATVPMIWAIGLALGIDAAGWTVPPQVYDPLNYLADGLIPVALLTLGVQLSRSRLARTALPLGVVTVLRLIVSPLVAAGLVLLLGVESPLAEMLIVVSGLPVAVNVFILSEEYGKDPELASQAVFWTTLLSAGTLSVLLALVR